MQTFFGILIGFLVLTILVVVHEFGHFIAAIKSGVKVKEFGIGFPPRAIAWQKIDGKWQRLPKTEWKKDSSELIFSLNWLPIGGFCSMDGENASDTRKGTFGAASFWAKTKILFAGVTFNFLLAVLTLSVLALTGLPNFLPNQFQFKPDATINPAKIVVIKVKENSPAAVAGLRAGDQITHLDHQAVTSTEDITRLTGQKPGQSIQIELIRDNQPVTTTATLNPASSEYLLGTSSAQVGMSSTRYTYSAPLVGLATTTQLTVETFKGLGTLLYQLTSGLINQFNPNQAARETASQQIDQVGKSVSGPIGIVGNVFPAISQDPTLIALLSAIISISLACMNVLPIPALDGGRWLLIATYKLRKKTLDKDTEERIVGRAFMVLIGLILLITVIDIIKLFK